MFVNSVSFAVFEIKGFSNFAHRNNLSEIVHNVIVYVVENLKIDDTSIKL